MTTVRAATHADIDELVRLREQFSAEFSGTAPTEPGARPWQDVLREVLERRLGGPTMHIVVVDGPDGLIACAAATVDERLPGPRVPDGRVGYVASVYTEPPYRHRGHGAALMLALLDWFAKQNVTRVDLHAADAAEAIYRRLGFVDHPGSSLSWRPRPLE